MAPLSQVRVLAKVIREEMRALFPHGSFQEGLRPFDLDHWPHCGADDEWDLLAGCFGPLATARGINLDEAIAGYLRVRAAAAEFKRRGHGSVVDYWCAACRERGATANYEAFARLALPAMAQFHGNGEIEGDFSRIKHAGVNARPAAAGRG